MRLNVLALVFVCALPLAGCGTAPPANVGGFRRIVGTDLLGARGATPADQGKIDATVDGLVEGGVYTPADAKLHQAQKSAPR